MHLLPSYSRRRAMRRGLHGVLLAIVAWSWAQRLGAQAELPRSDTLLLQAAAFLAAGLPHANTLWQADWFNGEVILLRPEGGAFVISSEVSPSLGTPTSVHDLGHISLKAHLYPAGTAGLPSRFGLFTLDGRKVLTWMLQDSLYSIRDPILATVAIVYHEAFHDFQHQTRFLLGMPGEASRGLPIELLLKSGFEERAVRERELLAHALSLPPGDSLKEVLRVYVKVRMERMSLLPPNVRDWEGQLERMEASAQLVGYEAALHAVQGSVEGLGALIRSDLLNAPRFDAPGWPSSSYRHWHVYATGSAIGILLDRMDVAWRSQMQSGHTFIQLLESALTPH